MATNKSSEDGSSTDAPSLSSIQHASTTPQPGGTSGNDGVSELTNMISTTLSPSPSKKKARKARTDAAKTDEANKEDEETETNGNFNEDDDDDDEHVCSNDEEKEKDNNPLYDDEELFDDLQPIIKEEASKVILTGAKEIVKYLKKRHLILWPRSDLPSTIDIHRCPQLGDSKNTKVYAVVRVGASGKLDILKLAGATGNGRKRAEYLKSKGNHPDDAIYITLFDLDHMNPTTNDYVVQLIRELIKKCCTIKGERLKQMTLQDALNSQSEVDQLPFLVDLTLYYLNEREAFKLNGLEKRIAVHLVESGFQELAIDSEKDLDLCDGALDSVQHEFIGGKEVLEKAVKKMINVTKQLNELLRVLASNYGDGYVEYLRSTIIIMKALSSWAPDIDCLGFTVAILDVMFGKGNWEDVYFGRNPCKRGEGDIYDTKNFDDEDHEFAKGRLLQYTESMKRDGSVGALDSNACLFLYMRTTAHDFLTGEGWKEIFSLKGDDLFVYAYEDKNWKHPAIIVRHDPPCPIMNSNPKVAVDKEWVNISRKRAFGMAFLDEFSKFIRKTNAQNQFSNDMSEYKILGNIVIMQSLIEYLVVYLHYYRFGASVMAKDFRVPFDVFCQDHTSLILSYPGCLSQSSRYARYVAKRRPTSYKIDKLFRDRLRCCLSLNQEDQIKIAADMVREYSIEGKAGTLRQESLQNRTLENAHSKIGIQEVILSDIKSSLEKSEDNRKTNLHENKTREAQEIESRKADERKARFQSWSRKSK